MTNPGKPIRMDRRTVGRFASLINEHGSALYGDEWWPGNAAPWIDQGARLDDFCENDHDGPMDERRCAEIIDLYERYGRAKFGSGAFGEEFDLSGAYVTIGSRRARRLREISDRAHEILKAAA